MWSSRLVTMRPIPVVREDRCEGPAGRYCRQIAEERDAGAGLGRAESRKRRREKEKLCSRVG